MHTMTRLEELQSEYSDFYKEVYGFRPRLLDDEAALEQEIERLHEESKAVFAREREDQERAAVLFEQRISDTIAAGAKDRETALRWIHQAEDTNGDNDYLCYKAGLRYGYLNA